MSYLDRHPQFAYGTSVHHPRCNAERSSVFAEREGDAEQTCAVGTAARIGDGLTCPIAWLPFSV
jgi:hypothetical protein